MQIFPLKAKHGDAIIVKFESKTKLYTFVIDGGPSETAEEIADVYDNLGYIDIIILTHYDENHISGLIEFFSRHKNDKNERVGQVWVNGAHLIYYDDDENTTVAYDNAFNLVSCLNRLKSHGFIGQWRDSLTNEEKPIITDDYRIDILSPTKNILETLEKKFHDYVDEHGLQDDPDMDEDVSFTRVITDSKSALWKLAEKPLTLKTTFMNRTSIAILLQAEGKRILLMGDADVNVVTDAILKLQQSSELFESPLVLDLMKVSHHGSKANVSKRFLDLIDCKNYLFTTNGGSGGAYHPDRQTIAYIWKCSKKSNDKLNLFFNYPLSKIEQRNVGLLSEDDIKLFNIIDNYLDKTLPTISL